MAKVVKHGQVAAMLPTSGIKDDATRTAVESMQLMLNQRSGDANPNDPSKWLTRDDVQMEAAGVLAKAFGLDSLGLYDEDGFLRKGETTKLIDNLQQYMQKSLAYQILGQAFPDIDLSDMQKRITDTLSKIGQLQKSAFSAIEHESETRQTEIESATRQSSLAISQLKQDTTAAISTQAQTSATALEALARQVNLSIAQLGKDSQAAIQNEVETRTSKDRALARAINTLWSTVGGNDAVIEDGQLAQSGANTSQATKWNQVVAAVTDPNTGRVSSTSIRQELNSYASKANDTLNSIYSVRAQISNAGTTIVGGFALSATNGAGSPQGATIDFGVRADKFFIAATAETPNAASQIAMGNSMPFMVLTKNETVYGKSYPPGVYMKRSVIGEATIDTAQIADAAITSAKIKEASIGSAHIGFASIDTLHLAGQAVTIPRAAVTNAAITVGATYTTIQQLTVDASKGNTFLFFGAAFRFLQYSQSQQVLCRIIKNGVAVLDGIEVHFLETESYAGRTVLGGEHSHSATVNTSVSINNAGNHNHGVNINGSGSVWVGGQSGNVNINSNGSTGSGGDHSHSAFANSSAFINGAGGHDHLVRVELRARSAGTLNLTLTDNSFLDGTYQLQLAATYGGSISVSNRTIQSSTFRR